MEDFNINTDEFYLKQKVKIEIEIEPFKLLLAVCALSDYMKDEKTFRGFISEKGMSDLFEFTQLLTDKCGEAQELLRKQRGN